MTLTRALLVGLSAGAHALDDGSAAFYREAQGPSSLLNSTAVKVLLTEYVATTGARCIDGSPAAYYIRHGVGEGVNKWYIHHQGGGWCESMDDCLGRSRTGLGSSRGYPSKVNLGGGYFSSDPAVNPMMWNVSLALLLVASHTRGLTIPTSPATPPPLPANGAPSTDKP